LSQKCSRCAVENQKLSTPRPIGRGLGEGLFPFAEAPVGGTVVGR
jgi:hypothetical protein